MGIQQITKKIAEAMIKVQKMPLPKQVKLAALATTGIFGVGVLAGKALFGDSFEKSDVLTLQQENDSLRMVNDSINQELVDLKEKIAKEDDSKPKELKRQEYTRPAGADIEADTTSFYNGNGKPAEITYSRNGEPFEIECLTYDGLYDGHASVAELYDRTVETFSNAYGGHSHKVERLKDGTCIYTYDGKSSYEVEYDHAHPESYSSSVSRSIYKGNKCIEETYDYYINPENKRKEVIAKEDKTTGDWIIEQEKTYDKNGVLKYTVTPKYNEDGDLIKRDTIWVNK